MERRIRQELKYLKCSAAACASFLVCFENALALKYSLRLYANTKLKSRRCKRIAYIGSTVSSSLVIDSVTTDAGWLVSGPSIKTKSRQNSLP